MTWIRQVRRGAAIGQQLMAWTRSLVVGAVNGLLQAELAVGSFNLTLRDAR